MVFSLEQALKCIPDFRKRFLTDQARAFAENGMPKRRHWRPSITYWEEVVTCLEQILWEDAYYRKLARIKRINERSSSGHRNNNAKQGKSI